MELTGTDIKASFYISQEENCSMQLTDKISVKNWAFYKADIIAFVFKIK
jgi:hypothetical protein